MDEYLKLVPQTLMENGSKRAIKEITQNSIKFLNSLYEYKNYLKFQYIFDDIKTKYQEKEQHKNSYNETKKEISIKEKS